MNYKKIVEAESLLKGDQLINKYMVGLRATSENLWEEIRGCLYEKDTHAPSELGS